MSNRLPTKGDSHKPNWADSKKNKPGKWRMIVDLSAPQGMSVNDGIDSELSSLSYVTIDQLAALVVSEGKGAFWSKQTSKKRTEWSQCMQKTSTC